MRCISPSTVTTLPRYRSLWSIKSSSFTVCPAAPLGIVGLVYCLHVDCWAVANKGRLHIAITARNNFVFVIIFSLLPKHQSCADRMHHEAFWCRSEITKRKARDECDGFAGSRTQYL